MSDGPHRSLPMSRVWKKAAESADNSATELSNVAWAAALAIQKDWRSEISPSMIKKIQDLLIKPSLFSDGHFDELRRTASDKPFANFLIDCLNHAENSGYSASQVILKAVTDSIRDRTNRALRQIQEHYIRKGSNFEVSQNVITRIDLGLREIGFESLARKFLKVDSSPIPRPSKMTDIEDGPQI